MRKLIKELPPYWQEIPEMLAIQGALQAELLQIKSKADSIILDAFIDTASEERISQWEKKLTIVPTGSLKQRRLYLKSVIRGFGKLNEEKIKTIVSTLTGSSAAVRLEDGAILLTIAQPVYMGEDILLSIDNALRPRLPAHLGLGAELEYTGRFRRLYTGIAYQLGKTVSYHTKAVSTDFVGLGDENGIQLIDNEYGFLADEEG